MPQLRREVGLAGAVLMGLGSIVGTGVFVSIGLGAEIAGPAVVLAILLAAGVAAANGLSSAQLAASHPVSGGTYEYGYKYLNPALGFTAGWMFLCAKSASAATAALGFSGYLLNLLGVEQPVVRILVAVATVAILTAVILRGIRSSNRTNTLIVSITLAALFFFVAAGLPGALANAAANFTPFFAPQTGEAPWQAFLHATALMFVAYTGYGRIATLGEEVHEPQRTIPRAIITALLVTMLLYGAVGFVAVAAVGADEFAALTYATAAPLEAIAQQFGIPGAGLILAVGAMTAMLGVLLNLILGLSRVLLAMGRRRDMPPAVARIDEARSTPTVAVIVMGVVVGLLTLVGSVKATWSFSAFTVLVYYAITNLAALQLPPERRLYPRPIAWAGLAACAFLAFWVEPIYWLVGLGMIGLGLLGHYSHIFRR
jgi:APA family basic amino acid/polyamine antiporter